MHATAQQWHRPPALLSESELRSIHEASLWILEEVGVQMSLSPERLQELKTLGARIDFGQSRVFFEPNQVDQALEQAPARYTLCARNGQQDLVLDGTRPALCLDGTGLQVRDLETGAVRSSKYADLARAVRLADALPEIGFLWPCVSAQDKPAAVQPLYELLAMLENSGKHVQAMTAVTPSAARDSAAMAAMVCGGEQALKKRPILSSFQCSISPLSYDGDSLEAALIFARAGVPAGFMIMPIGCATAPASLGGQLAQGNAELLAGITFLQLFCPGAPTFYGSCATEMELKKGGVTAGGPEDVLLQAAFSQLARFYSLPSNIGTFATKAPHGNWQAGVENTLSGVLSLFCGADMLCGAGLMGGATLFACEQLIMDCEIFSMLQHTARGMRIDPESLALDAIREVGPGGHFLTRSETLSGMRELWQPEIFHRGDLSEWRARGEPAPWILAGDKARRLLLEHEPPPLEAAAELRRYVDAAARQAGET